MRSNDPKYSMFALCNEMLESVEIIRNFDSNVSLAFVDSLKQRKRIMLTGEGSSRIFPAKQFIGKSLTKGADYEARTEGSWQAMEYDLSDYVVFGASNSGKTKELVSLILGLANTGHPALFGLTATPDTPVATITNRAVVLQCGKEKAVAATKSVVEQALFYESLLYNYLGQQMPDLKLLAKQMNEVLQLSINQLIVKILANAPVIYFSGRNNGVAEELALKTNEITRKKSAYLEGTYAVHGIEEVMNAGEVMVIIEPFENEEAKFREVLVDGVGMEVIAISSRQTSFPTIRIPNGMAYRNYLELAAGWNLLTEIGIELGIELDTPKRARKIGNEAFF